MMKKLISIIVSLLLATILTACGAAQTISEGTVSVAKAIFVWDVKTVHLDITARAELNTDDSSKSSAVVIRMYQLSDEKSFESATYPDLVSQDQDALGEALLATHEIVLKPDTSVSVDNPFDKKAQFLGIVALFKDPDLKANTWRILLKRGDLNISSPRSIIANKFTITLVEEE